MSHRINNNYLKMLILNAVEEGNHLSEDIIAYVLTTPYCFEEEDGDVTENLYGGGVGGIRTGITAMKKAGYLTLYPKDEYGNSIQVKPKRPFHYFLTATGEIHSANPHIKREHRLKMIDEEAHLRMEALLKDDITFKSAVKDYVDNNRLPKINVTSTKALIIRNPRMNNEKIVINAESNNAMQGVTQEEYDAIVRENELYRKTGIQDKTTIMTQQYEMQGQQQQISDLYYALEGKEIKPENIKRRNLGAMRIAQRKDLIYAISGIDMDAIESEVLVEIPVGAEFFYAWGLSMWVWKVQGARLFNRGSIEILGDENKEIKKRGHGKPLSEYDIDNAGLFITKIRRKSIQVDAVFGRMSSPENMKL